MYLVLSKLLTPKEYLIVFLEEINPLQLRLIN